MTASLRNRQSEASECGLSCIAMAAHRLGSKIDLPWLRQHFPASARGMSLARITDVAHGIGMTARSVRCELNELKSLHKPAILHWGLQHFVLLEGASSRTIRIFDPSKGPISVPLAEVGRCFTGIAVELSASPTFKRKVERPPFNALSMFQWSSDIRAGLLQTLLLSLLLQVFIIVMPLYMQTAIDNGALRGDTELLSALAFGFLTFAAFNAIAESFRVIVMQRLSALLTWDMSRRLFHHMVRLPLPWFEKRKLADTLTRFQAIDPIKNLVATGLIGSMLDGILSVSMLALMFIYSTSLGLVAFAGFLVSTGLQLGTTPLTLRYAANAFQASIAEQGKRIETLRAIQTIKTMSGESKRESVWANKQAELIRTGQASGVASGLVGSIRGLIDFATTILLVYLAAKFAIAGAISVGAIYAFMSYRTQFSSRAGNMIDQLISWRLLEIYTARLADVVLTEPEKGLESDSSILPPIKGELELDRISFRYGPSDPLIFHNLSLSVTAGESVAIVGPSGCGKSTLVKAICGLYPVTVGEIRLDGMPLSIWGPRAIRSAMGAVLQNDDLLPGSILDNVAFFDDQIDVERVWECLARAAIADEVRRLPMGEHTYVGDLGSALSGGQKQRILLARALYKQPRIMVLDEATAHLDIDRERRVNEYLRELKMTRIVVAHRPETIAAADRVVLLQNGLHELGSGDDYKRNMGDRRKVHLV
ncbi:peptidase domain-containing ABC transporter [Novosphingopyxis sp.]|uniref:peptidase domain-containing ABC transporter n=1 Tax=Novosphingopyxis sp. TaxID=2709690 RepID=UPI003B5AD14F